MKSKILPMALLAVFLTGITAARAGTTVISDSNLVFTQSDAP